MVRVWNIILCFTLLLCSSTIKAENVEKLLNQGCCFNNCKEYEKALDCLNLAVLENPSCVEVYEERAISYFELGDLEAALRDYRKIVELSEPPRPECRIKPFLFAPKITTPEDVEFRAGVARGLISGMRQETVDFSSCIRGSLHCLWAFVCHPIEVSKDLSIALYSIGSFISNASGETLLYMTLPEVMECRQGWKNWDDGQKGRNVGFILGKYSVSGFYNVTLSKGFGVYSKLKRANFRSTLKLALSKKVAVMETSTKIAKKSQYVLKKTLGVGVVPHHAGVAAHVMQPHHNWKAFLTITGNWEKDFKAVASFLEKHNIFNGKRQVVKKTNVGVVYSYKIKVGEQTVDARFLESCRGRTLTDAWVETAHFKRT